MDFKNKKVLITGASRGIGKATAMAFADKGASVGINYRSNTKEAEKTLANLAGDGHCLFQYDVSKKEDTQALIQDFVAHYGRIDVLVNNAGITRDNLMMRMKEEEWDDIMSTNLKSVFRLSKGVMRGMMKARTGRIINITSVVGVSGNAGQANYSAAKAGVIGFTKSLGQEIASRGITVNAIAPGFINTDMTKALSEDQITKMTANIPSARLGEPDDIAAGVVFLASDESSYVNGTTMHINGGMYMT